MCSTVLTLSCVLWAQAAADLPFSPLSVQAEEEGTPQAALLPPAPRRISPAGMVAEALTLPEAATLTGRPITLLDALSAARDQEAQLAVTHAYWRLGQAVADYCLSFQQREQLRTIRPRPPDAMMLRTAQASAEAALRTAELAARSAQHELAEAARLPTTDPLPLPADQPHVGPYRTYFDEVFSMRNPPAHARLIHRNLPIRRQLIEARAKAVQAAHDAVVAALDAYGAGEADLAHLLSSVRQWTGQYRAMLASVGDYNHDIADYALSVAGPQTDRRVLVAMLIRPKPQTSEAPAPGADPGKARQSSNTQRSLAPSSDVRPATFDEPAPGAPRSKQPPLAPLPSRLPSMSREGPTIAPPPEPAEPRGVDEPSSAAEGDKPTESVGDQPAESVGDEARQAAPVDAAQAAPVDAAQAAPVDAAQGAEPSPPQRPMVPVLGEPPEPSRTANKPTLGDSGAAELPPGLYPALVEASPAARTKHLAAALCWNRTLPEQIGQPIELRQCLSGPSVADRRQLIAAYWLAAQRAAQYQVLVGEVDFLEELVAIAIERSNEPTGPEEMLRLRAARLAAQADLLAAQLDLLEAQFQLTRHAGGPVHSPWFLAATTPHSGPYPLELDGQGGPSGESWTLRRLTTLIPALTDSLQDRAAAVVQADAARAAVTAAYRAGTQSIDHVLTSIRLQTEETRAFLDTLTQYNQTIADYALVALPPGASGEGLADVLLPAP